MGGVANAGAALVLHSKLAAVWIFAIALLCDSKRIGERSFRILTTD